MALRVEGSSTTLLNVHVSEETITFSNSQLMSDIGIPLRLLNSENYTRRYKRFARLMSTTVINDNNVYYRLRLRRAGCARCIRTWGFLE